VQPEVVSEPASRSALERGRAARRNIYGVALLLALALHAILLVELMRSKVLAPGVNTAAIPVTILEPSAPPPPPPPIAAAEKPASEPVEQLAKPEEKKELIVAQPQPTKRPHPEPKHAPTVAPTAQTVQAEAGVAGGTAGGEKGGVVGGAVGGEAEGQIGGIVGGQGDRPFPVGEVASPPSITSQILPTYPPLARAHGMEGRVVLELIVDREGHVESDSIRAKQSLPVFDQAAIEAVRKWRFRPGRDASGRAVRVILEVPIRFQLR